MFDDKEVIITAVIFGESGIEIGYFERRDQAEQAGLTKNIVIDRKLFSEEIDEITDLLEEIVDGALMHIRNPAAHIDPRKRIGSRRRNAEVEQEAEEPIEEG